MREEVSITTERGWGRSETKNYPVLTKEEVLLFNPKYIFSQRPIGVSFSNEDSYVCFDTGGSVPGNNFKTGIYAVKVKDFKEILASLAHFPNKKEGKILRRGRRS